MESILERVRGWVLFNAKEPDQAAQAISALFTQGGEEYVVIRADVAEGKFNLVVPVDVRDNAAMDALLPKLTKIAGPATLLRVLHHYPEVPHRAHSFVAPGEHKMYPLPEYTPPGRHPKSPGANPWG